MTYNSKKITQKMTYLHYDIKTESNHWSQ